MPLPSGLPEPRSGPKIGPPERLSATMALSLILFAVVILGVVFTRDDAAPVVPTLDVILTQTSTPNASTRTAASVFTSFASASARSRIARPFSASSGIPALCSPTPSARASAIIRASSF